MTNSTANVQTSQSLDINLPKKGMPVTIITGFLGSGKTTLLNHILNTSQDLKVAVLVNEFGDIDIDSQLLTTIDQDMVQLTNGCICCTINDDLVEAVYSVLEREEKIDHVVIETTGVADPLPIILTFVSSQLKDVTTLDSIITLVDSETFTPECFQSEAALNQITFGDIVVLNKTDLTTDQKVEELEEWIRERKWGARLLRSQQGQVPLPLILDTALFDPKAYEAEAKAFAEEEAHHDHDDHHHHDHDHHDHGHHHHGDHDHHHHDDHDHHHHHSDHLTVDGFSSMVFESDRPFILEKMQAFVTDHLPEEVFRAKGFMWFEKNTSRYIFQLSGKRYTMDADQWPDAPKNQLVFIGRNIDKAQLNQLLTDCLAP
ncbi:CobW family GTP-binding protein [Acaryochloris marina]|uniref:Cobalamin synthesis protein/P47K n=1 Tax=Acaryochloris marina (strain MBIC 11017) TaxID=329726 RepID=B0CCI1_ACAM1|nr:GTP-binding protein [Acaryochloris marina]ABW28010.1 cobalamin synthesis protein/P47K [Acaryochloris marina MBIC11017]BDM82723.1 GTP-binding protein [Acaryochloris marina MBIC10699]